MTKLKDGLAAYPNILNLKAASEKGTLEKLKGNIMASRTEDYRKCKLFC